MSTATSGGSREYRTDLKVILKGKLTGLGGGQKRRAGEGECVKGDPQFPGLHIQMDVDVACRSQRLVKRVGTRPRLV